MPVQVEQLGRAITAETEHQFTLWTLATPDPLERVLEPGYFARCFSRFRLGDLLICATSQPPPRAASRPEPGSRRRTVLMVTRHEPGAVEVRMVEDWGAPMQAVRDEPVAGKPRRRRPSLAELAGIGQWRRPARGIRRQAARP
ncbi:MAG: hypothetical protein AB7I59_03740 [Geminicoccaceae bacterium]